MIFFGDHRPVTSRSDPDQMRRAICAALTSTDTGPLPLAGASTSASAQPGAAARPPGLGSGPADQGPHPDHRL